MKGENLAGRRFGNLLVAYRAEKSNLWVCQCDCGNIVNVSSSDLKRGQKYCKRCVPKGRPSHKLSHLPEYAVWQAMKQRCNNKNNESYANYGGRGISYDKRWDDFEAFLFDMGRRPSPNLTLERVDNDGNYCKSNCVWDTRKAQARNFRHNKILEYNGFRKCISEWAELYGLKHDTIATRLEIGWSVEDAITMPVKQKKRFININGEIVSLKAAEKILGMGSGTLAYRLDKMGLSEEEAISMPIGNKSRG